MSTDAHANGPDDGATEPDETGSAVGTDSADETRSDTFRESTVDSEHSTLEAGGPDAVDRSSDTPLTEPEAEADPVVEASGSDEATGAVETSEPGEHSDPVDPPDVDQTHVALPSQRPDDFAEVDGGEPATPDETRTTAFVPTADEDAALRDERARRFGRPTTSADPDADSGSAATVAVPVAPVAVASVSSRVGSPTATQTIPATPAAAAQAEGEDDPFRDFDDGPTSRAAAHWWSILISIVFVPVAWYLITDGGERISFNLDSGGPFNLAGPLELAGGVLCLFFVLLAARWSSVGVILTGTISALLGIAFLAVNDEAMAFVAEHQGTLVQGLEQLGQNIVDHLLADASTGRLAVYGIVLVMTGVISHGARRQGRREERRKAALGA